MLYREATHADVETFLTKDFIQLGDGYTADNVKKANRKRLALAMEALDAMSPADRKAVLQYTREYCDELTFNAAGSKVTINGEEDLKMLLFGIQERYYTTRLGHERRLANSIVNLDENH